MQLAKCGVVAAVSGKLCASLERLLVDASIQNSVENDGDDGRTPAGKSIRPTCDSWPCELERWLIAVNVSVGDGIEKSLKFEKKCVSEATLILYSWKKNV